MTLAPGERHTLAEIEDQLSRTDPALAASFGQLATGRARNVMQPTHTREPGPRHARLVILAVLGAALIIACIAMAVSSSARPISPRRGPGPGVGSASVYPAGQPAPGR
jgi:hypothetical protein